MELGAVWRESGEPEGVGRGRAWRGVATELGARLAVVARIFPWGWHRELSAERLVTRVESAYRLEAYPALWKIEALGYRYAATSRELAAGEPPPPLSEADLPPESLMMLHVGYGMALARRRLAGVRDDAAAAAAVRRFLVDARRSAAPACLDAVVEPLGVVARFEHPRRVAVVGRGLASCAPSLEPWFWHGVGRALLFLPATFLPLPEASWRAARRLAREVPPGMPRHRARVGWACGLTLVHMRQPELLAELLRRHGGEIEAAADGFADDLREGIAEAVEVRCEVTPGCADLVERFLAHRPRGDEAAERWRRLVEEPGLAALATPVAAGGLNVFARRRQVARRAEAVPVRRLGRASGGRGLPPAPRASLAAAPLAAQR